MSFDSQGKTIGVVRRWKFREPQLCVTATSQPFACKSAWLQAKTLERRFRNAVRRGVGRADAREYGQDSLGRRLPWGVPRKPLQPAFQFRLSEEEAARECTRLMYHASDIRVNDGGVGV